MIYVISAECSSDAGYFFKSFQLFLMYVEENNVGKHDRDYTLDVEKYEYADEV